MEKEKIVNNQEIESIAKKFDTELEKFEKALCKIEEDIVALHTGDKNGAYWSGKGFSKVINSCNNVFAKNVELYKGYDKCSKYLNSLIKN